MSDALFMLDIANRLQEMVRSHNRERVIDALGKSVLGLVFCVFTFGFVYVCAWFVGLSVARSFGLHAWQFAGLICGLFLLVACWSAWRHVDPMAGLPPRESEQQELLLTLISQAAGGGGYFNPRHAVAGLSVVLIGGPANLLEGLGIWVSRLRADQPLIEEASSLLAACRADYPIERVREPAAAILLKRLALIKVVPCGDSSALAHTAKGAAILAKAERSPGRKPAGSQASAKRRP